MSFSVKINGEKIFKNGEKVNFESHNKIRKMLSKRYGIEVHNHALMDAEDEPLIIDAFDNTYTIIVKIRVNNRFCDFCRLNFKTVADHEIHKNSDYHLESMNNLMGDGPA